MPNPCPSPLDMPPAALLGSYHQAGFVPPAQIRRLQDYLRLRADHLSGAAASVQHQQKALERMNVKLHDVISSLVGMSGIKVVEAILAGERDPDRLLALCAVCLVRLDSRLKHLLERAQGVVAVMAGDFPDQLYRSFLAGFRGDFVQAQIPKFRPGLLELA